MRKAFTVVELGVVIALIATFVVLLLPAIQQARDYAERASRRMREAEELTAFVKEKVSEAERIFADTEKREKWVRQQEEHYKKTLEEERQRQHAEIERIRRESSESWEKFWAWCKQLGRNAVYAVLGLIGVMIAARVAPPLSRGLAALFIRRQAPAPRKIADFGTDE